MIILPAIDIMDGQCVRLVRGDYGTAHKVAEDAVAVAQAFEKSGAEWLHMVDLNGAVATEPVNSELLMQVLNSCRLKVELGGGIRSMETVDFYLSQGVSRVILGSAALKDPALVKEAVRKYGERVVVGIDAKNGFVAAEGWTQTSDVSYLDLAKQMEAIGVQYLIFTDISRDGMLTGPNIEMLAELDHTVSCRVIASGGVSSADDIRALAGLNLYGAICGKALYTGDLNLDEAVAIGRGVA